MEHYGALNTHAKVSVVLLAWPSKVPSGILDEESVAVPNDIWLSLSRFELALADALHIERYPLAGAQLTFEIGKKGKKESERQIDAMYIQAQARVAKQYQDIAQILMGEKLLLLPRYSNDQEPFFSQTQFDAFLKAAIDACSIALKRLFGMKGEDPRINHTQWQKDGFQSLRERIAKLMNNATLLRQKMLTSRHLVKGDNYFTLSCGDHFPKKGSLQEFWSTLTDKARTSEPQQQSWEEQLSLKTCTRELLEFCFTCKKKLTVTEINWVLGRYNHLYVRLMQV